MRSTLIVPFLLFLGLYACQAPAVLTRSPQPVAQPALTLADVMPVTNPDTPEALAKQAAFVEENVTKFRSPALASEYYVLQAQRTFQEEKLDSATYFYSRAYLMDSTNNDIYWGYGLVHGQQQRYDKALFALNYALEKNPNNARLLNDIATTHLSRFYESSNPADLLLSKQMLERAVVLSPEEADLYYKLAINNYYLQEYERAWEYLHKSQALDASLGDAAFIEALLEKQQDPQAKYPLPPKP